MKKRAIQSVIDPKIKSRSPNAGLTLALQLKERHVAAW